ncbi:MAG TPA: 4-(cytidine 5'-diphospho)-2-C-methyl-D-erythritol kinase [Bryobacteraceae bacterium]|jgi:4-diphosphocytidyl-2-C-methyl-D-erythritol kinase|nr:4-(cytidine 5'-diphospho)-2-C-methyl-D-erythritol kinase [Bryobacteraceae bacterium]
MAARLRLRSFAKINLDLRVLNKRPDGYHDLRTIFQTISLSDTLDIEYEPGRTRIDIKSNLNIPDNLVVCAADSVLKATRSTGRLGFVLQKRIPLGGGLGGGSSNAAAVLLALPLLLRKPLPIEKLMELAAGLGSDVPFFLLGGTALGLGRGTELYPLPDVPVLPALLIAPGIHVSTKNAYAQLGRELTTASPIPTIDSFQSVAWRIANASPSEDWGGANDFENVVFGLHPQLKSIKGKLLRLGARPALMSGSGSSLFGIFPSRQLRDRAVESFRKEFAKDKVYSVTMISRSRYRSLWRRQLAAPMDSKVWPPQDRYAG